MKMGSPDGTPGLALGKYNQLESFVKGTSGPSPDKECPQFCDPLGTVRDRESETGHISGV